MTNLLTTKLERFAHLSAQDRHRLDRLCSARVGAHPAGHDVARAGDRPQRVHLLLSGWAGRVRVLDGGRRQIVALLLPGDICDFNMTVLRAMDHSITALTPVTLAELPVDGLERLIADNPRIGQALWQGTLVEAAIQREWMLGLARRDAIRRVAHLFCELFHRLCLVGLTEGDGFELPLTQTELAEATGMTPVHANRTLQELRARGLIRRERRRIVLPSLDALQDVALFTPNYLHMGHLGREPGARRSGSA